MAPPPPSPESGYKFGWMKRVNRVPHYQQVFQAHDGLRQWEKTPKSKFLVLPFKVTMYTTLGLTMFAMCRMVLGHKTWYGPG